MYPGEFEVFWLGISSPRNKGMKSEAFEAWRAKGKPGAEVLIAKWNQYLGSLGDTYPKDVCRWIAKRGWLEEYAPAPALRTVSAPAPPAPGCWWHRQRGSRGRPSNKPEANCPECKHIAARNGTRSGEPSSIAELMGGK